MDTGFNTEVFSYDDREWEIPVSHYQDRHLGNNAARMTVCGFQDGNAYAKDGDIGGGRLAGAGITAYIFLDELGVEHPEVSYDAEADKLMVEEIEGSVPAHLADDPDPDSFYSQLAARGLLGDTDVYKNVLWTGDSFTNIDYENIGHTFDDFLDENESAIEETAIKAGIEYEPDEIYRWAGIHAGKIDCDRLYRRLRGNEFVDESWRSHMGEVSIDNLVSNVRRFS